MTLSLSADQIRRLRARAQLLDQQHRSAGVSVAQVARDLCGVQAQYALSAALAIRARSSGFVADDVERARVVERSVVRTWTVRGTLHLVASDDLGWLRALLGPVFIKRSRRRHAELGLDADTLTRGAGLLRHAIAEHGPLTRAQIVEQLARGGIRLEGQATPHLIGYAAFEGLVCTGPDRNGEPTYVLLEDWTEPSPRLEREAAQAELTRRYLAAYGPAGPHDMAAWSGLSRSDVRTGWHRIAGELIQVESVGQPAWMLAANTRWLDETVPDQPIVRLVPSFDTYLLGYKGRELAVGPEYAKRIHPGGGIVHPVLLVDGRALGTWRIRRRPGRLEMTIEPFEPIGPELQADLDAEVADIGRFLDVTTSLSH